MVTYNYNKYTWMIYHLSLKKRQVFSLYLVTIFDLIQKVNIDTGYMK
jgi:hypothetical protein